MTTWRHTYLNFVHFTFIKKSLSQFLASRDLNYFLFISDEAENLWVSIYSEQSEQYFPTEFKPYFWWSRID